MLQKCIDWMEEVTVAMAPPCAGTACMKASPIGIKFSSHANSSSPREVRPVCVLSVRNFLRMMYSCSFSLVGNRNPPLILGSIAAPHQFIVDLQEIRGFREFLLLVLGEVRRVILHAVGVRVRNLLRGRIVHQTVRQNHGVDVALIGRRWYLEDVEVITTPGAGRRTLGPQRRLPGDRPVIA